ncbi:MAG: hypothetical protein O2856_09585 [Planctomycetota bacterium]|nr:hypothetical protein [Planctomycetota bacterium]
MTGSKLSTLPLPSELNYEPSLTEFTAELLDLAFLDLDLCTL